MTLLPDALMTPMLLPSWMDPEHLVHLFGPYALWGVALIIFAECGLFCLLPGDSLLFTVGLFVAIGAIDHSMWFVCTVLTVAAVLGNVVGYGLGRLIGPPLFKPRRGLMGRLFKREYVDKTELFFARYGNRALVLARFVPIIRTFVTFVAGVGKMDFRRFITYTAIGAVVWAIGVTVLGYYLGKIKIIHDHIELSLILIVVVSAIPMIAEYLRARRKARNARAAQQESTSAS